MNSSPEREDREASAITPGHVVLYRPEGGEPVACLKAEREGKEYIHHYLVQLDPVPEDGYCLIYVDPEQVLTVCAEKAEFTLNDPVALDAINRSDLGYIIETAAGVFLKVSEDPKMQKFCGYVDIRTGEVKRRQERGVVGFYPRWTAEVRVEGGRS